MTARSPVEIMPEDRTPPPPCAWFVQNGSRDENVATAATTGGTARRDYVWGAGDRVR